jgi:mono/diheme cytochrome c family protein
MPRKSTSAAAVLVAAASLGLGALPGSALAQGQAAGPAFTAAQADRGASLYSQNCAMCHGEDMTGGAGTPSLSGPDFSFGWKGKPASDLFDYVRTKMPPGQIGSLTDQQYLDVVTAILKRNGAAPGQTELTPGSAGLHAPIVLQP